MYILQRKEVLEVRYKDNEEQKNNEKLMLKQGWEIQYHHESTPVIYPGTVFEKILFQRKEEDDFVKPFGN